MYWSNIGWFVTRNNFLSFWRKFLSSCLTDSHWLGWLSIGISSCGCCNGMVPWVIWYLTVSRNWHGVSSWVKVLYVWVVGVAHRNCLWDIWCIWLIGCRCLNNCFMCLVCCSSAICYKSEGKLRCVRFGCHFLFCVAIRLVRDWMRSCVWFLFHLNLIF